MGEGLDLFQKITEAVYDCLTKDPLMIVRYFAGLAVLSASDHEQVDGTQLKGLQRQFEEIMYECVLVVLKLAT